MPSEVRRSPSGCGVLHPEAVVADGGHDARDAGDGAALVGRAVLHALDVVDPQALDARDEERDGRVRRHRVRRILRVDVASPTRRARSACSARRAAGSRPGRACRSSGRRWTRHRERAAAVHASEKASAVRRSTGSLNVTVIEASGATPDSPSAGSVLVDGRRLVGRAAEARAVLRRPARFGPAKSVALSSVSRPPGSARSRCRRWRAAAVDAGRPRGTGPGRRPGWRRRRSSTSAAFAICTPPSSEMPVPYVWSPGTLPESAAGRAVAVNEVGAARGERRARGDRRARRSGCRAPSAAASQRVQPPRSTGAVRDVAELDELVVVRPAGPRSRTR